MLRNRILIKLKSPENQVCPVFSARASSGPSGCNHDNPYLGPPFQGQEAVDLAGRSSQDVGYLVQITPLKNAMDFGYLEDGPATNRTQELGTLPITNGYLPLYPSPGDDPRSFGGRWIHLRVQLGFVVSHVTCAHIWTTNPENSCNLVKIKVLRIWN